MFCFDLANIAGILAETLSDHLTIRILLGVCGIAVASHTAVHATVSDAIGINVVITQQLSEKPIRVHDDASVMAREALEVRTAERDITIAS